MKRLCALLLTALAFSNANAECSAATMQGSWGIRFFTIIQGAFYSSVSIYTFKTTGNTWTASSKGSQTGNSPVSGTASGTFTLAASCMGTMTGINNLGTKIGANFVITEGGQTFDGEGHTSTKLTLTLTGHKL